jgi:glycosyltransferase involved in cell wall biosynthesis
LSAEKGHLVLIDALARLRDKRVDVRCTIIGSGPLFDDAVARVRLLRLADQIEFTGALPSDRVAEKYADCDVVVLPSFSEGVPVVLMEAMAAGRAVVATRVGGVPELVEHGRSGFLVSPGDAQQLAEAVERLAEDSPLIEQMGRYGVEAVRKGFDVEVSARQLQAMFREHLEGGIGWTSGPPPADQKVAKLLVVSPVRNEGEFLQQTIDSMVTQAVRPAAWIIVDDGSTDDTSAIVERAAAKHNWIRLYRRPDRGVRKVGGGVVDAFNEGLEQHNLDDFEYVCKFDGDLAFGPRYFEGLLEKFQADPQLGTASGKSWIETDDGYIPERTGDAFSQGQTKLYRVECFKEIGGFVREVMWDGIDCHRCRMTGWEARSFRDPELRFIHLRPMGSSFRSIYHGRLRWGYGQYFMGTHPLYLLGISCYRMFERPWVIGGILILAGYVGGFLRRRPRYDDRDFRRFLRRWQMARLGLARAPEMP